MRLLKCQYCGLKDATKDKMLQIEGKKGYYHILCLDKFNVEKEEKQRDLQELDDLYNLVKEIHNTVMIDKAWFNRIQDVRNGNYNLKGRSEKKKKAGVRYSIIKQAYLMTRDKIEYYQKNKEFENKTHEILYCLLPVLDNLNDAYAKQEQKKSQKKVEKRVEKQVQETLVEEEVVNKKRKDELDISNFI